VGTPDVAIFDWNMMFVFDFSGMNENVQDVVPEEFGFLRLVIIT
jgi:hypothetical protein